MEQQDHNRTGHSIKSNSSTISSDLLNRCVSGRHSGRSTPLVPSRIFVPGGVKKRVFLPNIPKCQEDPKQNIPQEKSNREHQSYGRGYKSRDKDSNNRGRGRGRGRGEIIQLKGSLFGEGLPERTIKKDHAPRHGERSGGDRGSIMQMPKYTPASFGTKSDDEEEEESLKKLFKDDFIFDDDDDSNGFTPVKLPLFSEVVKCKKEDTKLGISKIKIKTEPTDDSLDIKGDMMDVDYEIDTKNMDIKNTKKEIFKHENEVKTRPLSNLFTNNNTHGLGDLFFFHFPDCLPKDFVDDTDDETEKNKQNPETRKDNDKEFQNNSKWALKDMPEGMVGKLQILKSGRMRLKIGAFYFDVMESSQIGFLQQVVSLKMTQNSGDLHVLGLIKHKVVCFPNLETLTNCSYV